MTAILEVRENCGGGNSDCRGGVEIRGSWDDRVGRKAIARCPRIWEPNLQGRTNSWVADARATAEVPVRNRRVQRRCQCSAGDAPGVQRGRESKGEPSLSTEENGHAARSCVFWRGFLAKR